MQKLTKQKSRRIRRTLLALSDAQLAFLVEDWLKVALRAWPLNEHDDEALFALGYQLKVGDRLYASWEDFDEDEELDEEISLSAPMEVNWREKIIRLALPTFYHSVLWAAGESLDGTAFTDAWGPPPGEKRSGYDFLDKLADYLVLARKLSKDDLDRFTYAARQLNVLPYAGGEDDDPFSEAPLEVRYSDIDVEIARLIHEPELPYFMRAKKKSHKRKRK